MQKNISKEKQILNNFLIRKNLHSSSRRNIILEAFLKEDGHITPEELYGKVVQEYPSIGIATVYRTLKLFYGAGIARVSRLGKRKATYERNYLHNNHHDHFVCKQCGDIIEFKNPEIKEIQERITNKYKFNITSHLLEFYGRCSNCSFK